MPSLTLDNGVQFAYTDSGAVEGDYTTCVVIHGHTFHNGTFQRLSALAQSNYLRIIAVNRREYPGSSPYSPEDLAIFARGDETQRASLLEQQGRDLALFMDGLIGKLSLPETGGIALIGWSMGTLFLLSLLSSIDTLPTDSQARLSSFVRTVILLQTPLHSLGLPEPAGRVIPYTDPEIPPEARGPTYAKWIASYFIHGELSTHTLANLTYTDTDLRKRPPTETLQPEMLSSMADFGPADKYENIVALPPFAGLVRKQMSKALFDPAVRRAWGRAKFWNMYGSAEPWHIIYAGWVIEEQSRAAAASTPELIIHSKVVDGANHFLVWEDPERAINALKDCLSA
ncbi:Alpha/Beta hydrolase protein [Mycena vitilis]|nr:Alpha/Beta hydrolase protein [Mycena vitilis]